MIDRISAILISRFLLNLQEANARTLGIVSDSSGFFDRVIGSLGGSVTSGVYGDELEFAPTSEIDQEDAVVRTGVP